jgi:hypothetical protein
MNGRTHTAVSLGVVIFVLGAVADVLAQQYVVQPGPNQSKDVWTTSYYPNCPPNDGTPNGCADEKLMVGGWGDSYYTYIQFDLSGLPSHADSAYIQLYSYVGYHSGYQNVSMYLDRITRTWDYDRVRGILRWADRPPSTYVRTIAAPTSGNWYSFDITDLYNAWRSGTLTNYGIALRPTGTWDQFNYFRSSRYMAEPTLRPKLVVNASPGSSAIYFQSSGQRPGTKVVDVTYDLITLQGSPVPVAVSVSTNNGATFSLPVASLSGDVGWRWCRGMGGGSLGMPGRTGTTSFPIR